MLTNQGDSLKGIPKIYWSGMFKKSYAIVMELLGPSLSDLCDSSKPFSFYTTAKIGLQMFALLEQLHNKRLIHRDIKPDNFLLGTDMKTVYIIDFGLTKRYEPMPHQLRKNTITGTLRYASINSHLGYEESKRDDLESLCYVLIYLMKQKLPWQGICESNMGKKVNLIGEIKVSTSIIELCKDVPSIFFINNR